MTPSTVIDTAGHKLYQTRVVGKAWRDELLETYTPFGVIYQFGNSGNAVGFQYPLGFMEREKKRRDALDEFDEIEQGHGV
jgi:hypothetical protein